MSRKTRKDYSHKITLAAMFAAELEKVRKVSNMASKEVHGTAEKEAAVSTNRTKDRVLTRWEKEGKIQSSYSRAAEAQAEAQRVLVERAIQVRKVKRSATKAKKAKAVKPTFVASAAMAESDAIAKAVRAKARIKLEEAIKSRSGLEEAVAKAKRVQAEVGGLKDLLNKASRVLKELEDEAFLGW
jgi:hypothetical protein